MNPSFEKITQYIKTHCEADDFTLDLFRRDSHETRFAQNRITQHIAGPSLSIRLKVAFGNKSGSARINQDDDESLARLIKSAQDIARLNQPDPEHIPSTSRAEIPRVDNCDPATRDLEPRQMVDTVQKMINLANEYDAMVSGMTEKHFMEFMLITKNGFEGYNRNSYFGHSMTLKKGATETKVSYDNKAVGGFDGKAEFESLRAQMESLVNQQVMEPGKIAVILRPSALEELLMFMGWMMNRRNSDEGFTPYTGQFGRLFFGEKFSMYSTFARKDIIARPYSSEGLPSRDTTWIENGVIRNMPTNRYWAQKHGYDPCEFFNFYIPGAGSSEEEMMKMVPRGLIINRFWYIRPVDAKVGELTGMTRDGVLYFEDGHIKHAVNNFRFNEIPHLATRRILAMGPSLPVSSATCLPTMLIDDFNFVDKTSF